LKDSGWQSAAKADNFAEHTPGDQTKPPVETEAFITYDDDNLYVAMICYDDPATIRASYCERERVGADDNICLLIDTYADASWAYELNVNPYGIQADAIWSQNGGEDSGYDLIWESAGKITDVGYQIEMAIPFSSLRFPNQAEQVWKVDFWRNHPRELRRQYSWAAYDRNESCWPCKWGTITGIKDVQPGKGLEIMPTFIGFQSGALTGEGSPGSPYEFDNENAEGEVSLNGKMAVSSDITVEATYNPDFSQVEADQGQVDVNTTFALSFPERRPFFQEGRDLFGTIFNAVYTRSINNPEFAGKVTARMGRTSIAYLGARDENTPIILPFEEKSRLLMGRKSTSNILRVRQTMGDDTQYGFLITDRRLEGGGSGTLLSTDAAIRITKNLKLHYQHIATRTSEADDDYLNDQFTWLDSLTSDTAILNDPLISDTLKYDTLRFDNNKYTEKLDGESFWGHALFGNLSLEGANHFIDLNYLQKSATYRADNGFQPANNYRSIYSMSLYHFRFDEGFIQRISPSIYWMYKRNFDGVVKDKFIELGLEGQFSAAQLSFHALYNREAENYAGIQFDNVWKVHNCIHSRPNEFLAMGGNINFGHQIARGDKIMGKELSTGFWVDIKPTNRLLSEYSFTYIKSNNVDTDEELYKGYLFWTRFNYQFSKEITLRIVGQYNDFNGQWDIDPLLTYRLNPFSKFYIGSTMNYNKYDNYDVNDEVTG
ncbi:DUF5916 domain-containing protein, partial [Candidatus Zixiibacteriota bacterium]